MALNRSYAWIIVVCALCGRCSAQAACYPGAGVAGIVVATVIVTAIVMGLVTAAGYRVWNRRKVRKKQPDKHSSQKAPGDFAFDNPYFRDQEDDDGESVHQGKGRVMLNSKSPLRSSKQSDMSTSKSKKSKGAKGHFIFGGGCQSKKQRTMDDTFLNAEPERTVVALKGHDFTGLGFNICGNMRDGILVKDVLHRGPASESGRIKAGDRILSVTVSFTNIVYEDALTILSYASPYNVQLELERTASKSSAMQPSPAGSKRLGSGSFSSSGPKLFHPLYRSQSIDDLTQIDRDTFPSHGFGPRRSQSVGVAAHKLAAHFKNSDTRLEEKERPSASAILSTTGSLNEKMLANVMTDGALQKCGLQWEKRFEDNLEGDVASPEAAGKKDSKASSSSTDDEKTEKPSGYYKRLFGGSSRQSYKNGNDVSGTDNSAEVQITAQVHQHSLDARSQRAKSMAETSDAVWQLEQSIREADSDSSRSYPWNGELDCARKSVESRKNQPDAADDSDSSRDSHGGEKQRRKKKHKHKTSSLGDLSQTPDTANKETNCCSEKERSAECNEKDRPVNSCNNDQKSSKRNKPITNVPAYREQNASMDSLQGKPRNDESYATRNPPSSCAGSSATQFCSKEKRMERAVINSAHSPKLSVKSPKQKHDPYTVHNEPPYQKQHIVQHFQHPSPYSSSPNSSESQSRMSDRTSYNERPDVIINSRNLPHQYVPNNVEEQRGRFPPHGYQQRPPYVEYQKASHPEQQYHRYDNDVKREPPRNGPPPYYQALRKANPAGMFTQINPFQQPSNRQRNNFPAKPWAGKDLPSNGGDPHYSMSYATPVQVTTIDSSGRHRNRVEPPPYPPKMADGGHAKTIIISTYDNANNNHPGSYRQARK